MKRITTFLIIIISLIPYSCVDEVSVVDASKQYSGKLVLKSVPDSANIFLLGTYMNKTTPDSILNLESGEYDVTLKLKDHIDTTFTVTVSDKLRTEIGTVLRYASTFGVFIHSEPKGAEIFLSNKSTKKFTPDSVINLSEGFYTITLKKQDYIDTTFSIEFNKSNKVTKDIILKKRKLGSIFVDSEPNGAQIRLLDENTGKFTPDSITNLEEGLYNLTLKLQGCKDTTFNVDVKKNKVISVDISLVETLPLVTADLSYTHIQFGQVLFNFYFNRHVYLDNVEVLKPDSTLKSIFSFGNSYIPSGEQRIIIFSDFIKGRWRFTFYGSAIEGTKSDFVTTKEISVQ